VIMVNDKKEYEVQIGRRDYLFTEDGEPIKN
jgi:hypothetical protein